MCHAQAHAAQRLFSNKKPRGCQLHVIATHVMRGVQHVHVVAEQEMVQSLPPKPHPLSTTALIAAVICWCRLSVAELERSTTGECWSTKPCIARPRAVLGRLARLARRTVTFEEISFGQFTTLFCTACTFLFHLEPSIMKHAIIFLLPEYQQSPKKLQKLTWY